MAILLRIHVIANDRRFGLKGDLVKFEPFFSVEKKGFYDCKEFSDIVMKCCCQYLFGRMATDFGKSVSFGKNTCAKTVKTIGYNDYRHIGIGK